MTRRSFVGATVVGAAAHTLPGLRRVEAGSGVSHVTHLRLHGNSGSYCGHPRQCGLFNFGGGELAVLHYHAPCTYREPEDVRHDFGGYHSRAVVLLQRSLDGGATWPREHDVQVWNEAAPVQDRIHLLFSSLRSPREKIDLTHPNAAYHLGRTFLGPKRHGEPDVVGFVLRSRDRGRTWEKVPSLIVPPGGGYGSCPESTPLVTLPDGTLLMTNRTRGGRDGIDLYASMDRGLSWRWRTQIMPGHALPGEPAGARYYYPTLIRLKSGRLQCYAYPLCLSYSDDEGRTWSRREAIQPPGPSPWAGNDPVYDDPLAGTNPLARRSPFPLLLRDGRIVILFARRVEPGMGMGLIVSGDDGKTWSPDLVLRKDAGAAARVRIRGRDHGRADIGYPLATELEDGRIFTAYYYHVPDGNPFGGARFLAGTFFRLS